MLLAAGALHASSTAAWEMNTFQDFLRGRFTGVSLSRDGRIALAPKMESLFASEQPYVWSVADDGKGAFYIGTGHKGRVYKIEASGKSTLVWTSPEPEVFALAVAGDGTLFAATSPDGKIYRIADGKAAVYFEPGTRYIWALAVGRDGALYAGTGDGGKVYRIASAAKGEVYYDTGQSNVTCLTLDKQGNLLAGTDPNGMLYRISAKDKAFVLYDANLPEIRTVAVGPDGNVYAAALGGSVAQKANAASSAGGGASSTTQVTAPTTTITVTEDANAQGGLEMKPRPATDPTKQPAAAATPVYAAPLEMMGVEKSAIYRVLPDNTVETLWSSKEENIYDILLASGNLLFSTDQHGRIYRMTPDRRVTLLAQTAEGETIRLAASGNSFVAATGPMGKLYRLNEGFGEQGTYESPVHDAGSVARWGQISWRGERTGASRLAFQTRSGNSARPDRTWSEWSAPVTDLRGSGVESPNARFVQWRAALGGGGAVSPSITSVALSYLPQNNAPLLKSLNVNTQLAAITSQVKAATAQPATGTYSITVTDTGESGASSLSGTATQTVSRGVTQQIQIVWQAEDVDGDKLAYSLYFRAEDELNWKVLRANLPETSVVLEGDVFADGKYLFRVVASDRPSNAGASARQAELVSAPVQFDNTPPVLLMSVPSRTGAAVDIDVQAQDTTSNLRRAEYSLDAGGWQPLEAVDGVIDGHTERFHVHFDSLSPGEHLLVVRAYDASNNAGLGKTLVHY